MHNSLISTHALEALATEATYLDIRLQTDTTLSAQAREILTAKQVVYNRVRNLLDLAGRQAWENGARGVWEFRGR